MYIQVAGAAICATVVLYSLIAARAAWPREVERFSLVASLILVITIAAGLTALVRRGRLLRSADYISSVPLGLGIFVAMLPLLLNEWTRGNDYERYHWIIRQQFPCSVMGSGPGMVALTGRRVALFFGRDLVRCGLRNIETRRTCRYRRGCGRYADRRVWMLLGADSFAWAIGCTQSLGG